MATRLRRRSDSLRPGVLAAAPVGPPAPALTAAGGSAMMAVMRGALLTDGLLLT